MTTRLLVSIKEYAGAFEEGFKTKINIKEIDKMIKDQKAIDKERKLLEDIKKIADIGIYVGIPEEKNVRESGEMNNATLLYIHTNGSEKRNLPPRPLIEPALEANDEKIAADLAEVSRLLLEGNYQGALKMMRTTGKDALNMITDFYDDPSQNQWPRNQDATVRAKIKKKYKSKKKRKEAMEEYAAGGEVDQVLVDTGALRSSITYVIGDKVEGK
jgi:hypothetical protein